MVTNSSGGSVGSTKNTKKSPNADGPAPVRSASKATEPWRQAPQPGAGTGSDRPKKGEWPRNVDEACWFGLLYAYGGLMEAVGQALEREHGLTVSSFEVLLRLSAAPAPERVSDVASSCLLSPSRVSRVVEQLSERGLIEKQPSARDARAMELTLSEHGRALFERANATHWRVVRERLLDRITAEETATLASVWQKLGFC